MTGADLTHKRVALLAEPVTVICREPRPTGSIELPGHCCPCRKSLPQRDFSPAAGPRSRRWWIEDPSAEGQRR